MQMPQHLHFMTNQRVCMCLILMETTKFNGGVLQCVCCHLINLRLPMSSFQSPCS